MSSFTCITCRVAFSDAELQRAHYKTDWHRYNLKRKVADMPPVTAEEFQRRLLAQQSQSENEARDTSCRCQICNKHFRNENQYQNHLQSKKHKDIAAKQPEKREKSEEEQKNAKNVAITKELAGEKSSGSSASEAQAGTSSGPSLSESQPGSSSAVADADMDCESESGWELWEGEALAPEACLFCPTLAVDIDANIRHMTASHSFFLPDVEFVSNLDGLLTYLGEKVGEGHICLWCNQKSKSFRSTKAVQQHMMDKGHCKMLHEGDAVFEYTDYYDYRSSYPDYVEGEEEDMEEGEEDEEVDAEDIDGNDFQMVLPSGAVVGHRSLQRYYRQKLRPDRTVALRNSSRMTRVLAQYKSLGWTGTTGVLALKKAKDMAQFQRIHKRKFMQLGVKANKFQPHFRQQVFGSG